jgi:ribosome-associated translation inhibitor RaiA
MNLTISGHQLDITDALKSYARTKVARWSSRSKR